MAPDSPSSRSTRQGVETYPVHSDSRLSVLTLAQAARSLGVEHDTLRRQIRLGKLKARKVGPIWTVTEREVERYRQENRRP